MIVNIVKGSGVTGALRYVQGEGRDELTGEVKAKTGDNSRAELLGGQGFGFEIKSEADAELARKVMEWAGRPENQASKTKPCEFDCEHISLSWAKGQTPDNAEKIKAAEGVLAALGMANSRAISYAHHDADYAHIHIIASRIDPDTRRAYSAFEDMYKAQAWSLQWEREHHQITPARQWVHDIADAARGADHAALRAALTEKDATFSRKDVDRAFAWAGYFGEARKAPREAFLGDRDIVALREAAGEPVKAYTTREILADERAVQREARALHGRDSFGLKAETVAGQGIRFTLTREQAEALDHATAADGLAIIAGQAGAGKSRVLDAVREAYQAEGYEVRGMAWTNKVVANMRSCGFEASTIRAELGRVEREAEAWRGGKTVLVVDEAAQLSTKDLGALLGTAEERGAKVILTGDDKQLGSIERGGMFRVLRDEFGAAQLQQVQRVKDEDQQKAFGLMHGGKGERDFAGALRIFDERGAIHWSANRGAAIRDLGATYIADVEAAPGKRRLMLAQTNEEVKALNVFARTLHRERGELGEDHVLATKGGELPFARGDRVSITENGPTKAAKAAGLVNGAFGRIVDIGVAPGDKREVTVELDGERGKAGAMFRFVVGDNRALGEFQGLKHGYASTVYKSQGDTLDQIYALHAPGGRADSNYVAMTRHRESMSVFVARDRTKDFDALVRQMSQGADKTAASRYRYAERGVEVKEAAPETQPGHTQGPPVGDVRAKAYGQSAAARKDGQESERAGGRAGSEPVASGGSPLPDAEAVARGGQLDQAHRLGKQPGKTAKRLREAFAGCSSGLDYIEKLKAEGFRLAQVDGQDHVESVQRRDAAAADRGRKPRLLQAGELVAVNRDGTVYAINAYATGAKKAEIAAKLGGIDRGSLPNLKAAHFMARVDGFEQAASARGAAVEDWRKTVEVARRIEAAKERGTARGTAEGTARRRDFGRVVAVAGSVVSGIGSAALRVLDGFASMIEGLALTPEQRAERAAEDQARRAAEPSRQAIRDYEHEQGYRRDQDDKTKAARDPDRNGDLAASFRAAEREQDGGREIGRDKGGGSR